MLKILAETPAVVVPLWVVVLGVLGPIALSALAVLIALGKAPFEIKKIKRETGKIDRETELDDQQIYKGYKEIAEQASQDVKKFRQEYDTMIAEFTQYKKDNEAAMARMQKDFDLQITNLKAQHATEIASVRDALKLSEEKVLKALNWARRLEGQIKSMDPDVVPVPYEPKPRAGKSADSIGG